MRRFHLIATVVWGVVLVFAIVGSVLIATNVRPNPFVVLLGVVFISLCSIYANMVGHWGSYQAAKAEKAIKND